MFVSASSHGCMVVYLNILLTGAWLRFFWHYLPGEAQGAGPKQLATQIKHLELDLFWQHQQWMSQLSSTFFNPKHLTQRNPAHRMIKFGASHWTAMCFSKMCNSSKAVGDQKAFGYDMNIWYEFVWWPLAIFICFNLCGLSPWTSNLRHLGNQILCWFEVISRRVDFLVSLTRSKRCQKLKMMRNCHLICRFVCWFMPFLDLQIWFVFEVFGIETWWGRWFGW